MITVFVTYICIVASVAYSAVISDVSDSVCGLVTIACIAGAVFTLIACCAIHDMYDDDFHYYKSSTRVSSMLTVGWIMAVLCTVYTPSPYPIFEILRYGALCIGILPIVDSLVGNMFRAKIGD